MEDSPQNRRLQRALDRQERYPWLLLTKTFRVATSTQVLLVALVGSMATAAGWRVADSWVLNDEAKASDARLDQDSQYFSKWPGQRSQAVFPCECAYSETIINNLGCPPDDPLTAMPYRLVAPAVGVLRFDATGRSLLYYLLGGLWTVLVWAGFGCAITRMAVRYLARDDRVYIGEAIPFAQNHMFSVLGGVLGPLVGALAFAIPISLLGLLMRTNVGAAIGGLIWLFVLPLGLVMTVILIGMLFGWPLIWGAVATESSDAFDAISRAYSYTFQRPLHYLGYAVFTALIGVLGWGVVWLASEIVIDVGLWSAAMGAGSDRVADIVHSAAEGTDRSAALRLGGTLISFWNGVIRTLASSYAYSFFWSATAGIYLLLRHQVDAVELDEVHVEHEDDQHYGLPQLTPDEQGVPQPADA